MSRTVPKIIDSSSAYVLPSDGQIRSLGKRGHDESLAVDRLDAVSGMRSSADRPQGQFKSRKQEAYPVSCRCSISHVYEVISNLDAEKKELVRSIGFGGLLLFPALRQINRQFSIWLMSRVDPCEHDILIGSTRRVRFTKDDVSAVFGIPRCGKRVLEDGIATKDTINLICTKYLGFSVNDGRSVKLVRELLERKFMSEMSPEDKDSFKVAFVVYIMSTLLAPGAKYDHAAVDYWNAIVDPNLISSYDWSEHVLHKLLDSVFKVKSDLNSGSKPVNLTGCCLFLQVFYLDSIDLGAWNMDHSMLPRVRCFPAERLKSMIAADCYGAFSPSGSNVFGKSMLRDPAGLCYSWASDRSPTKGYADVIKFGTAWEATISVCRTLMVPLEASGPIFLAISEFDNRCCELVKYGGLNFVSALFSLIEPFIRGFRYNAGQGDFKPAEGDCESVLELPTHVCAKESYRRIQALNLSSLSNHKECNTSTGCNSKEKSNYDFCATSHHLTGRNNEESGGNDVPSSSEHCATNVVGIAAEHAVSNDIVRTAMSKYFWYVRRSKVPKCCGHAKVSLPSSSDLFSVNCLAVAAKNPWEIGFFICWDNCMLSAAIRKVIDHSGSTANNIPFFVHHFPKYVEVMAVAVSSQFLGFSELEMDMVDVLVRRFKQCDDRLYFSEGPLRWRHFVESDFMGSVLAGVFEANESVFRDQIFGFRLEYDVLSCSMIFFPFLLEHRWVCYAWAVKERSIIVFDPAGSFVPSSIGTKSHSYVVQVFKEAVANLLRVNCPEFTYSWESVGFEVFDLHIDRDKCINRSGIMCAYFCLAFDGDIMKPSFRMEYVEEISAMLLRDAMMLEGNYGATADLRSLDG